MSASAESRGLVAGGTPGLGGGVAGLFFFQSLGDPPCTEIKSNDPHSKQQTPGTGGLLGHCHQNTVHSDQCHPVQPQSTGQLHSSPTLARPSLPQDSAAWHGHIWPAAPLSPLAVLWTVTPRTLSPSLSFTTESPGHQCLFRKCHVHSRLHSLTSQGVTGCVSPAVPVPGPTPQGSLQWVLEPPLPTSWPPGNYPESSFNHSQ